jgi:hypothetical protein
LHLIEVLVDIVDLPIQQLCQFLDFSLTIDTFFPLQILLAFQVEGSIDGEPIQLSTLKLIVHIPFDTCQVAELTLFDVD